MKSLIQLGIATWLGGCFGIFTVLYIISTFSEMILSSVFNIYFASVFFLLGSYYTYKIFKKNQIQMSLENEAYYTAPLGNQSCAGGSQSSNINGINNGCEYYQKQASTGGSSMYTDIQRPGEKWPGTPDSCCKPSGEKLSEVLYRPPMTAGSFSYYQ